MNATPDTTQLASTASATVSAAERIRADYAQVRKLGHWTRSRAFDIRSRRGHVVMDLRSIQIPDGDLDIKLDLDHAMVKLLLPADAVIDDEDLRWTGRGRIKDHLAPRGESRAGPSGSAAKSGTARSGSTVTVSRSCPRCSPRSTCATPWPPAAKVATRPLTTRRARSESARG